MDSMDGGTVFTVGEFVQHVENALFIDYDGIGFYATAQNIDDDNLVIDVSSEKAIPSNIIKGNVHKGYTHIVWYNK